MNTLDKIKVVAANTWKLIEPVISCANNNNTLRNDINKSKSYTKK